MPIIIGIFCLLPLLVGLAAEYAVCRFPRRKLWRLLPPAAGAAFVALVALGRLRVWEAEQSPVTQLLFVPGVPGVFLFVGMLLGWRLWKYLWTPRVVKDRRER